METGNLEVYQQEDFDFDSIVLRRADPDDCDQIINLVEIGKDDVYNRVYSYPKILKLIETAYLAITVLDREGRVVAFAAFEDFPQVRFIIVNWLGVERHVRRETLQLLGNLVSKSI